MKRMIDILYGEFDNVETLLVVEKEAEKEKPVDEELNELFDEIDNFHDEATVVREVGPSRPITADEEKRKMKGKAVAENKDQLQPLKMKKIQSSDEVLFIDEATEEAIKRHDEIVGEWMKREMISRFLTDKELEDQRILMEDI